MARYSMMKVCVFVVIQEMSRAGSGNALWWPKTEDELSYTEQAAVLRRRLELRAARTGQGQLLRPVPQDELLFPKEDLIEVRLQVTHIMCVEVCFDLGL